MGILDNILNGDPVVTGFILIATAPVSIPFGILYMAYEFLRLSSTSTKSFDNVGLQDPSFKEPKNVTNVLPTPTAPTQDEKFKDVFDRLNDSAKVSKNPEQPKPEVKQEAPKKQKGDFDNVIFGEVKEPAKKEAPKVEAPKTEDPRAKFLSGLDNLSNSAKVPDKAFQQPKVEQPAPAKIELPTNEELRAPKIESGHAKFLKEVEASQKNEAAAPAGPSVSAITVESMLSVAPEDKPSGKRLGMMNSPDKINALIEALNKHTPGGGWEKGNDGQSHNAQISNGPGNNAFEVRGDSMVTSDNNVKTFEAMLVGFKAMYKDREPTVTASPETEAKWREAAKNVGVELKFASAEPKVAQAATKTADGPAPAVAEPERPRMGRG